MVSVPRCRLRRLRAPLRPRRRSRRRATQPPRHAACVTHGRPPHPAPAWGRIPPAPVSREKARRRTRPRAPSGRGDWWGGGDVITGRRRHRASDSEGSGPLLLPPPPPLLPSGSAVLAAPPRSLPVAAAGSCFGGRPRCRSRCLPPSVARPRPAAPRRCRPRPRPRCAAGACAGPVGGVRGGAGLGGGGGGGGRRPGEREEGGGPGWAGASPRPDGVAGLPFPWERGRRRWGAPGRRGPAAAAASPACS